MKKQNHYELDLLEFQTEILIFNDVGLIKYWII